MCGIVGIVREGGLSEADVAFVREATPRLAHRGPDDEGIWATSHAALGHRRLSIIDLGGGAQPMTDVSGRYTVTFNGEIYNYPELRTVLEGEGYRFRTKSDTEVILNGYAHWGPSCVERFNGIFAFGLWDASERSVLLARDHLGVKPLLYYTDGDCLIFASELKAVLRHARVPRNIDAAALSDYLSLGYVLAPKTIIRQIRKVPAASRLLWRSGGHRIECYWDLAAIVNAGPRTSPAPHEAAEALRAELERAVRTQLISDVPVGAFLSGGIDSSSVVQKMVTASRDRVKTFSLGFPDKSYDELPYARLTADHLGTQHFAEVVTPDLAALLPCLAWYFDEPFADTSAVPTYLLCQLARRHTKVALSGDGGDECFAGYDTYVADRIQTLYRHVPSVLHRRLIAPAVSWLPASHRKVSWDYKLKQFVQHARSTPEEAHYSWRLLLTEGEKRALRGGEDDAAGDGYTPFDGFRQHYRDVATAPALHQSLYVDIKTWLVDAMLVKVDRASMACGLEVRVPLLDYRLVEFAMSLPPELKLRRLRTKALLKDAMAPVLPRAVIRRAKRGFNAPVARWVRELPEDLVAHRDPHLPGFRAVWETLWKDHEARRADNGFKLWALLSWSLWQKAVLD